MEGYLFKWMAVLFVLSFCCSSDATDFSDIMQTLYKSLQIMNAENIKRIELAKVSILSELDQHVQKAVENILEGQSLEHMFQTNILSKMRKQEMMYQQTKTQLQSVMMTLNDVQRENVLIKDALLKSENDITNLKSVINGLNETCQAEHKAVKNSQITTPSPVQKTTVKNRMIITTRLQSDIYQLDIQTNELTELPFPNLGNITALCYVESSQRLLVGLKTPHKIMSVTLTAKLTETLKEGVWIKGMGVDETQDLIFMTTIEPTMSISRMSLSGQDWTVVLDLSGYWDPDSLAVNTKDKELYVCTRDKLIRVSYNGDSVKTLATGYRMYGVTFDSVGSLLYFNDFTGFMRMSIKDKVSSEMIELDVTPYTLAYYNNTVYYGAYYGTRYVGAVQVGENVVNTVLQTMRIPGYDDPLIICLVP